MYLLDLDLSVSVYVLLLPQRSKKYAPAVNSQAILCRDRDQDRPRSTPRGQSTEEGRKNKNDRDGTRTHNPLIRSQMRYPLRHAVIEHHHSHPTQQQTNHTTNNTTKHTHHTPHYTYTPPLALSHASRTPQHANKRANTRACIKPLQLHTRPRARPARTATLRHFNISTLQQFNSPTFQLSNYPTIQRSVADARLGRHADRPPPRPHSLARSLGHSVARSREVQARCCCKCCK